MESNPSRIRMACIPDQLGGSEKVGKDSMFGGSQIEEFRAHKEQARHSYEQAVWNEISET